MTVPSPAPRPSPFWYVQAGGRVWGPYPQARLAEFAREGRLTAQSLVGSQASGPFGPVERCHDLQSLFATDPEPSVAKPEPELARPVVTPQISPQLQARAMLVWADLASLTPARFEAVIAAYGPYAAIRSGLWLVQARMRPAALRNALSRRLRSDDALLVVEAPLEQTAWFNLAPAGERDLRQLWSG